MQAVTLDLFILRFFFCFLERVKACSSKLVFPFPLFKPLPGLNQIIWGGGGASMNYGNLCGIFSVGKKVYIIIPHIFISANNLTRAFSEFVTRTLVYFWKWISVVKVHFWQ